MVCKKVIVFDNVSMGWGVGVFPKKMNKTKKK